MKVLLIATNRHGRYMNNLQAQPLPLGLAYIAGYLNPEQHSTKMLDLMFADDYLGDVEKTVKDFQPDLVGLSLRNLDNGSNLNPRVCASDHERGHRPDSVDQPSHHRLWRPCVQHLSEGVLRLCRTRCWYHRWRRRLFFRPSRPHRTRGVIQRLAWTCLSRG